MRKKFTSIILTLTLVFMCALTGVAEAAQVSAATGSSSAASVKSGDYMYYSIENKLYKVNVSTKKTTLVYKNSNTDKRMWDLTVKDGWIYGKIVDSGPYEAESVGYVFRVRTTGKNFKKMKLGTNPVIYNGSIYYYKCKLSADGNFYDGVGIYKMTLSGSSEKCIKKTSSLNEFIIYKSNIYYTNTGTKDKDYLRRMPIAGGTSKIMFSFDHDICSVYSLKAYNDYIYFNFLDGSNGDEIIYKIKTTSTTKYKAVTTGGVNGFLDLMDLNSGYIYYSLYNREKDCAYLYRMNLSTKAKTLIMKKDYIVDATVSSGYMIVTYNYFDENAGYIDDNTCKYLCTTTGKSGKILGTYWTFM
ncbi:MAG: hypothetical protein SPD90_04755 [Intestinibacter sp.]|uniref:hypothetical protein n=1 Tax=Intestinibacter sp. TaxID=1965304 RepID=UPI002A81836F|nr:hypothetical protein [Intestinibacter sp.]MDY4574344.1 hypothetical protein [Intestinibacter sp.]